MRYLTSIFLLISICFSITSFGQHIRTQEIEIDIIERLQLNLDEVFAVEIITGDFSNIRFTSEAEGEYAQELQIDLQQIKETLYISSIFDAILSSGYDKLSSHKVFSFQIKIFIPERLQVYIISNIADVQLKGKLAYFEADLKNGDCTLLNHEGNAKINTYRGNISVQTRDAQVKAETRTGKLRLEEASYEKYLLELKSVESNIDVIQLN